MLSDEQIKNYNKDGYLILPNLFSQIEINELKDIINVIKDKAFDLAKNNDGLEVKHLKANQTAIIYQGTQFVINYNEDNNAIARVVWAGSFQPKILEYGRDPRITEVVAQILESSKANHIINQIHFKLPGDGVGFAWHQDVQNRKSFCPHWQDTNNKGSYVVAITAIDSHTMDNSPLFAIPGSHAKELDFPKFCQIEDLPESVNKTNIIPLLLSAGSTVLIHPYLLHASFPNESQNSRYTLINGFSYPGANADDCKYPGENSGELIDLAGKFDSNLCNELLIN